MNAVNVQKTNQFDKNSFDQIGDFFNLVAVKEEKEPGVPDVLTFDFQGQLEEVMGENAENIDNALNMNEVPVEGEKKIVDIPKKKIKDNPKFEFQSLPIQKKIIEKKEEVKKTALNKEKKDEITHLDPSLTLTANPTKTEIVKNEETHDKKNFFINNVLEKAKNENKIDLRSEKISPQDKKEHVAEDKNEIFDLPHDKNQKISDLKQKLGSIEYKKIASKNENINSIIKNVVDNSHKEEIKLERNEPNLDPHDLELTKNKLVDQKEILDNKNIQKEKTNEFFSKSDSFKTADLEKLNQEEIGAKLNSIYTNIKTDKSIENKNLKLEDVLRQKTDESKVVLKKNHDSINIEKTNDIKSILPQLEKNEKNTSLKKDSISSNREKVEEYKTPNMNFYSAEKSYEIRQGSLNNISKPDEVFKNLVDRIKEFNFTANPKHQDVLSIVVDHKSLGEFKVTVVQKSKDEIKVKLVASNDETFQLMETNRRSLIDQLQTQGIKVSEFVVENTSDSKKDQFLSQNSSNGQDQFSSYKKSSSDERERDNDSKRRQELWDLFLDS